MAAFRSSMTRLEAARASSGLLPIPSILPEAMKSSRQSETANLSEAALMVPVTAGMIVLAYNIPGVNNEIKLPRDVYIDIFAGVIKRWDDPRIKAANPGLAFPARDIAFVARQDSSGTTAAFTKHLAAIGSAWRNRGMGVGKLIEWPKGTMLASGNEGVAARIKLSEGSIGYVEYWFAQRLGLRMAALQNRSEFLHHPDRAFRRTGAFRRGLRR